MTEQALQERTLALPIFGTKTHCSSGCCWFSAGKRATYNDSYGDMYQCLLFNEKLYKDTGSYPARRCEECMKFEDAPQL